MRRKTRKVHTGLNWLIILSATLFTSCKAEPYYIRINQVGFYPWESKSAVVMSNDELKQKEFFIADESGKTIFRGKTGQDHDRDFSGFRHHYLLDFSSLDQPGTYHLWVGSESSLPFSIGNDLYNSIPDTLLRFFAVQRCGETSPLLHGPCHLLDGTRIKEAPEDTLKLDLTGGWHDAADYIKFLLTTSFSSYMLLLTDELFPQSISDRNGDGLSDALEEARIGLEWMMKMHYNPDRLLTQVQDHRDHLPVWRLPDFDPMVADRPAYYRPSRAQCGTFAAAMAIGKVVFSRAGEDSFATLCLQHAREVYLLGKSDLPDGSTGPDSMYYDKTAEDNMALAAVELFRATGDSSYLVEAKEWARNITPNHWFSWGDLSGLSFARLAPWDSTALTSLNRTLTLFDSVAASNVFGYPIDHFPWGSATVQAGIASLAVLYDRISGDTTFEDLALHQRDFILGCNPHGISFISRTGTRFASNFHHQVSWLQGVILPGGFAAGYVSPKIFNRYNIQLEWPDSGMEFQSESAVYHDDRMDFISNEPTISGNAIAFFLFTAFRDETKSTREEQ